MYSNPTARTFERHFDGRTMPFGRYRGIEILALPPDYLTWLGGLDLRDPLRGAVQAELKARRGPGLRHVSEIVPLILKRAEAAKW